VYPLDSSHISQAGPDNPGREQACAPLLGLHRPRAPGRGTIGCVEKNNTYRLSFGIFFEVGRNARIIPGKFLVIFWGVRSAEPPGNSRQLGDVVFPVVPDVPRFAAESLYPREGDLCDVLI
jgi:hypothetical protein